MTMTGRARGRARVLVGLTAAWCLVAPTAVATAATVSNSDLRLGATHTADFVESTVRRSRRVETRLSGPITATLAAQRHRVEFRVDADLARTITGPETLATDYHGDVILAFDVENTSVPYGLRVTVDGDGRLQTTDDSGVLGEGGTALASMGPVAVTFAGPDGVQSFVVPITATRGPTAASGVGVYGASFEHVFPGPPAPGRYELRFQWDARCESRVEDLIGDGTECLVSVGLPDPAFPGTSLEVGVEIAPALPPFTPTRTETPTATQTATATQTPTPTPTATPGPPELSIGDASVVEGNSGSAQLQFPITVDRDHSAPITVRFRTADETALAGDDYTAVGPVTLTLRAGVRAITVAVPVRGDLRREGNERLLGRIGTPGNAVIADDEGVGTIVDDELVGTPELTSGGGTVRPDAVVPFTLRWTHPDRWRALDTVDLRLVDDAGEAFWGRFTEGGDTFGLCENGACGGSFAPGSGDPVPTGAAVFHPAASAVRGSGPTGPFVDLTFAVSLPAANAGRRLRIEVAAADDGGEAQEFAALGTVTVASGSGSGDGDGCQVGGPPRGVAAWPLFLATALAWLRARTRMSASAPPPEAPADRHSRRPG